MALNYRGSLDSKSLRSSISNPRLKTRNSSLYLIFYSRYDFKAMQLRFSKLLNLFNLPKTVLTIFNICLPVLKSNLAMTRPVSLSRQYELQLSAS